MAKLRERLATAVEGRYEILDELGRGGMSMVFAARDVKHDRTVAVKVLLPELAASVGAQRFLREIEIAAGLVHPHILPLYDSGDAEGLLYHVTPCVEGETLRDRLKRERYLSIEETVRITVEVADALDFAHARDVIHRDIKPENVMLSRRHALITDFGIARAITLGGGERLTETGMAVGTPAYMSPEQARGEAVLDGRSDIYSLACLTYEMLAGEAPLAGRSPQITMARRQSESPTSLTLLRETVPEPLNAAVLKALARLPADRFPTASQYGEAVQLASGTGSGVYAGVSVSGVTPAAGTSQTTTVGAPAADPTGRLTFWEELKRRKVYNVAVVYVAASLGILGFLANMKELYGGTTWFKWLPLALLAGFPVSVVLAWMFEVSRDGVQRTGTYEIATKREQRRWPVVSRRAMIAVALIVVLYVIVEVVRRSFLSPA
ncbi:MAG: serine/threonine protein kinase [Gemmatimonadetes bacterium]|nr:serine/threonine protein kinase [Gemmatimonadota bacterium]